MKQITFSLLMAFTVIIIPTTHAQKILKQVLVLQMPEDDGSNSAAVAWHPITKNITRVWRAMQVTQWAFLMKRVK